MAVKSYPSREIIKNYGTVADMVAAGEPVRVTKHGRTAYYMIPPSDFAEDFLKRIAAARFVKIMNEAITTPAAAALSDDDLTALNNANT